VKAKHCYLVLSKINRGFCNAFLSDGFDEQARRSDEILIINIEASLVLREHNVVWSKIYLLDHINVCATHNAHLKTGTPVTVVSLNAVYQSGSMLYLRRRISRTISLYGCSSKNGSRRLVSICACARKKGANAPTWYHRTSISGSGLPKNPPTSATSGKYEVNWSISDVKGSAYILRKTSQRC